MPEGLEKDPSQKYPPSVVAAEQRAREFLAQSKWRKARDEIKPLVKLDPAHFLPLLIEANTGLAREMISKGHTSEARQVLNYLATIAPADQLRALELEFAAKSGDLVKRLPEVAAALADPSSTLPEGERAQLADQAVTGFKELPADDPACAALAAEVRAVHEALRAVSEERWQDAAGVLRGIHHRSAFKHWAAFIKGTVAFHTGDLERAERFFRGLPAASVPAKASQAYLMVAGRSDGLSNQKSIAPTLAGMVGHLVGGPDASRVLPRASQLWREGRHVDSYKFLRDSIRPFPALGPDWVGTLTEFYFQAPHTMSEEHKSRYLNYFENLNYESSPKNPVEEMLIVRMLALADEGYANDWDPDAGWAWDEYLDAREKICGPNRRLKSIAYTWLGKRLARKEPSRFGFGASTMRNPIEAEKYLREAANLDTGNLEAYLELCQVYDALKHRAKRNRLLDEMTRRFPEEKPVLVLAGRHCLDRKAYTKGLDFFERARRLDRLDQQVTHLIVTTRWRMALQLYEQGKTAKARQAIEGLEEHLTDKPDDAHRGRWTALVRRGVLEQLHGDAPIGAELLAQAQAMVPAPAAYCLFAHLAYGRFARPKQPGSPFLSQLNEALKRSPSVTDVILVLKVFVYWNDAPEKPRLGPELGWLRKFLRTAAKQNVSSIDARQIIGLVLSGPLRDERRPFVQSVLRQDPHHPEFRFYDFLMRYPSAPHHEVASRELEPVLEEARKRGDHDTIRKIQTTLRELKHRPPPMPAYEGVDYDDSEEDEPESAFDGPPEDFDRNMPPPDLKQMTEIMSMLAGMSKAEIRELRKNLSEEMPPFIFDMLVEAAKSGMPLPPLPGMPPVNPPKPSTKPPQGGGQLDLW